MSSFTEASRWPEALPATRRVPALAVGRPARLALVSADASRLCVEGRRPMLAPLLLSPLFTCLGTLPWLAPEPINGVRAAVSGLFLLAAAGLASWAFPWRQRLVVSSKGPAPAGAINVQPGAFRWRLETRHVPNALHATYAVTLEPHDGPAVTVLEGTDPAPVLWQLSEVLRHWPGSIDCSWNLPSGAEPWSIEPQSGSRAVASEAGTAAVVAAPVHRGFLLCSRLMALFVVLDLVFLVSSAGVPLPGVHPLSLVLPVLLASFLVTFTLAVAGARSELHIGGRVRREDSVFGVRRQQGDIRIESIRGVHVLGLTSADRWHVLIDSSDGPLSLSVPRGEARALALEVERAIAAARAAG